MLERRHELRRVPGGDTESDLQEQHVHHDLACGCAEDAGERGHEENEADRIMNVYDNHVSGGFS